MECDQIPDAARLPQWDLTAIFPDTESPELQAAMSRFATGIDALSKMLDSDSVRPATSQANAIAVATFETITSLYNELLALSWRLEAYCYSQIAADAGNVIAQDRWSEYARLAASLEGLRRRCKSPAVLSSMSRLDSSPNNVSSRCASSVNYQRPNSTS